MSIFFASDTMIRNILCVSQAHYMCLNLKHVRPISLEWLSSEYIRHYSSDSRNIEAREKRKKFLEIEEKYEKLLKLDKLTIAEKIIHALHAEAVQKGHFTYDDPVTGEKVLTRLRHFLKGKCCGKSCRHCIYEHSAVLDEERKAKAWFNTSFWQYDDSADDLAAGFEDHEVVYGRGPYPRKYAQNANTATIKITSSSQVEPQVEHQS